MLTNDLQPSDTPLTIAISARPNRIANMLLEDFNARPAEKRAPIISRDPLPIAESK